MESSVITQVQKEDVQVSPPKTGEVRRAPAAAGAGCYGAGGCYGCCCYVCYRTLFLNNNACGSIWRVCIYLNYLFIFELVLSIKPVVRPFDS